MSEIIIVMACREILVHWPTWAVWETPANPSRQGCDSEAIPLLPTHREVEPTAWQRGELATATEKAATRQTPECVRKDERETEIRYAARHDTGRLPGLARLLSTQQRTQLSRPPRRHVPPGQHQDNSSPAQQPAVQPDERRMFQGTYGGVR